MAVAVAWARSTAPTGRLLQSLLDDIPGPIGGVVGWGSSAYRVGSTEPLPMLNRNCTRWNKLTQAQRLHEELGDLAISPQPLRWYHTVPPGPWIARSQSHREGRDIIVMRTTGDFRRAIRLGRTFMTPLVPSTGEFRVWIFRGRHMCTYHKEATGPEYTDRNIRRGADWIRCYRYGWRFHLVHMTDANRSSYNTMIDAARGAVAALELDFGAVDVLMRPDGCPCVLEVNSAPGVENRDRFSIQQLSRHIHRWAEGGFRRRNGEETQ